MHLQEIIMSHTRRGHILKGGKMLRPYPWVPSATEMADRAVAGGIGTGALAFAGEGARRAEQFHRPIAAFPSAL